MLESSLRLLAAPWKSVLNRKVKRTLAEAEAAIRPGDMPKMKVVGEPPVRLTEEPTPAQVADFVRWRSPAYVGPMSDGVAVSFARMLRNADRPAPFGPADMNRMILTTPSAYVLEQEGDDWVFDLRKRRMHPLRRMSVVLYRFDRRTGAVQITDADGRVHREGDPTFETALNHVMCWWCHAIHSGLHNWVHFHLPDCMNEAHTALSDPDSVLARLLAPHVRFTARINMAGLWLNQSTDNGPQWWKRLKPWGAAQSSGKDFQRGVIENTAANYADLPAHFARPEQLDLEVPYLRYLHAWFGPIDRFVAAVEPHLEEEAWEELLTVLERGLPTVRALPRRRLLAEFIWQVGVVHAADHLTFCPLMAKHGYHVVPETLDEPFTLDDVGRWDRLRTRTFADVFVTFHGVPGLDHALADVGNYRFEEGPLAEAAAAFRAELLGTEARLREEDLLLVPAGSLAQSVCF